jgi:hypothetical protein
MAMNVKTFRKERTAIGFLLSGSSPWKNWGNMGNGRPVKVAQEIW